jgi:hypothetical protein
LLLALALLGFTLQRHLSIIQTPLIAAEPLAEQ